MTTNYKGFRIETKKTSHCAIIYKGKDLVKCVAGDIKKDSSHTAINKAKKIINNI